MHQIFCASLFVPIFEVNETDFVLSLFACDHANRGTTCAIWRKFYLKFNSMSELQVFQSYNNSIFDEWNKKNGCGRENSSKEEVDAAGRAAVQSLKKAAEQTGNKDDKQKKEDNNVNTCCNGKEEPPRKKRKLEEIIIDGKVGKDSEAIVCTSRMNEKKKEVKEREDEEDYKTKYQQLEHGDGLLDLVDDQFESTQNPFGVDDSF